MHVSLKHLLKTGQFGLLNTGIAERQLRDLLGAPDDEGNKSRKYPWPSILKYGDVEFFFARKWPRPCTTLYLERPYERKHFEFPATWTVEDWDVQPGASVESVQRYLDELELPYVDTGKRDGIVRELIMHPSNVRISFHDEDELLWSISADL